MASSERLMKRILAWGIVACLVVPAVVLSAGALIDQIHTWQACSRFDKLASRDQLRLLQKAASERDHRLAGIVRKTLETTSDRVLLEAAGFAAMRMETVDTLPLLQKRADEGPDDPQRAQLVIYAARLSDRDLRLIEWLRQGTQSNEPWRRVGAAVGLLNVGQTEAGPLLIQMVRTSPAAVSGFALHHLRWVVGPMSEAVGRPISFPQDNPAASVDAVERFWRDSVTIKLLNDVLLRLTVRDPDWAEIGRLIHARNRVAKWLQ
jgi:hypothetical protein